MSNEQKLEQVKRNLKGTEVTLPAKELVIKGGALRPMPSKKKESVDAFGEKIKEGDLIVWAQVPVAIKINNLARCKITKLEEVKEVRRINVGKTVVDEWFK